MEIFQITWVVPGDHGIHSTHLTKESALAEIRRLGFETPEACSDMWSGKDADYRIERHDVTS